MPRTEYQTAFFIEKSPEKAHTPLKRRLPVGEERPEFFKTIGSVKKHEDGPVVRKKIKFTKKQYRVLPQQKMGATFLNVAYPNVDQLRLRTYGDDIAYSLTKRVPVGPNRLPAVGTYEQYVYALFFGNAQNYKSGLPYKNFLAWHNNRPLPPTPVSWGGRKKSLYGQSGTAAQERLPLSAGGFGNAGKKSHPYGSETGIKEMGNMLDKLSNLGRSGDKKTTNIKTDKDGPAPSGIGKTTVKPKAGSKINKDVPINSDS